MEFDRDAIKAVAVGNRRDVVVEDYHGMTVADPFRWLEDPKSEATRAWTEAQNTVTREWLDAIAERGSIRERLEQLFQYTQYGEHIRRGERVFFMQKEGLQNQPCLYVQDGDSAPRLLVDANALREDGTAAIAGFSPNRDGSKLAYSIAQSGSDWQVMYVMDVESGEKLADELHWCKFTRAAWNPEGTGFFYTRFPEPDPSGVADQTVNSKIFWHNLGAIQDTDELVYERPDAPGLQFYSSVSHDGEYLVVTLNQGTDRETRIHVRRLDDANSWERILDEGDALYHVVGNIGRDLYVLTDRDAPNRKVVRIPMDRPEPAQWSVVIAESEHTIDFCSMAGGKLLVVLLQDAHHEMQLVPLVGADDPMTTRETLHVELPTMGSLTTLSANQDVDTVLFGLTSFLNPNQMYELNVVDGKVRLVKDVELGFPADEFETKQIFYTSKDGTEVPMFLSHRKGLEMTGENPVWLTGYGGFNLSRTPAFSATALYWMEQGGVFALANLRGGSEYGETWHRNGMRERKQNVFDDLHAAAEWLASSGYSNPGRIAIQGGSNGGLLVSATMLQRPELYGAVICQVPVIDMLRYQRFTAGRYWVGEYGNAEESAEDFAFMYAYSPLHNVVQSRVYPPLLITTADSDDRVVPSHAKKFCATMQAASPGVNPVLLRVDTGAGHGAGKPTSKIIDEQADILAFLRKTFRLA